MYDNMLLNSIKGQFVFKIKASKTEYFNQSCLTEFYHYFKFFNVIYSQKNVYESKYRLKKIDFYNKLINYISQIPLIKCDF